MKAAKCAFYSIVAVFFMVSIAAAAGNAERGKVLFSDAKLSGSTTGNSCNFCHPNGRGLEESLEKKEWKLMGKKYNKIEDAINIFIEKAMHGRPLDPNSQEMLDLIAYIGSLKKQ
ncbi:MAG: hypothetical protein HZB33_14175 [Nitrospirae bacterium]|nr:hypothetical protein [Nitrospirota bacterium]